MSSNENAPARRYRSRKQKPCDNCRRRRVCCVRDAEGDCALCSRRSIPCTFSSEPSPRKRRARSTNPSSDEPKQTASEPPSVDRESQRAATPEPKSGADGKYVGLSGTDDVYFVVDRLQACGNDPAREAYFRERTSSVISGSSGGSNPRTLKIEPDASLVRDIFFEQSHPVYPLLDANLARSDKQSRLLAVAVAIITKYTSPELVGLHSNVLIEELTASLLLESRTPSLETVEGAILFTQRALRGKMSTTAPGMWAVIGTLVGMCHELGLNIDCSTWRITPATKSRRKRIWWATYMQDKWFAMALGRPSYLNDANTTTSMLTALDFEDAHPESADDGTRRVELVIGINCFVAMAELTVILNEVLSIFFTISSVVRLRDVTGDQIIETADQIEAKLESWRAVSLDPILTQRVFPDVTGSLELAYITVRVMLLRGVFPKLHRRNMSMDRHVDRAVDVTSQAISLIETLQINRLSAFWWSCSGFNFALVGTFMASLKRLSTDSTRANYWDGRLKYYRKLLAAHGMSFWPAKFAATALDLMAKNLTKATAAGASEEITDGVDVFTSPGTSWSGVSYDFFPHNLTVLNELDFNADWAICNDFQWQSINMMTET